MNNYREAESLIVLREQIQRLCPFRDTRSDGWIGDSAHQSRMSDHNPWVRDGRIGIVTAMDFDKDLNSPTITAKMIIDAICQSRDNRVKYIIWNRQITVKGSNLSAWTKYEGPNAHQQHFHISVFPIKRLYDSTRLWVLPNPPAAKTLKAAA